MFKFLSHHPKWVIAVIALMIFGLSQSEWLTTTLPWQKGEGILIDLRYRIRGERQPNPNIQLIGLNTTSFKLDTLSPEEIAASPALQKMLQPWPWDRSIYAAILEKLMAAGAKAVLFDFVLSSQTEGDDVFARALEKYKNHVVIDSMIDDDRKSTDDEKDVNYHSRKLSVPNDRLLRSGTENIVGLALIAEDPDGIFRHARYRTSLDRERLESGGLDPRIIPVMEKSIREGKTPDDLIHATLRIAEIFHGPIRTPPSDQKPLINYQGSPGTYLAWPVENMFVDALWKKPPFHNGLAVSNKIVIVGPMSEIFHDIHVTPYGEMPGSEILAQMTAALLENQWLTETGPATNIFLSLLSIAVALLVGFAVKRAWFKAALGVCALLLFALLCQLAFEKGHCMVLMLPPLFCLVATGSFEIIFEFTIEQLERKRYRNVLDRYVSKNVAKTILEDRRPFLEALNGRKQLVTILFSDIRSFSTISETCDAEKLVAQLNEYFGEMVGSVLEKEGTLQKFIGDAIMAVWGDTHSVGLATDARLAVTAALQMRTKLIQLNADWSKNPDRIPLSIGIGVNHGEVIVGNIGHPQRMEFTVLGDSVNLAARLESATKQFHSDILIGEDVEKLTRDHFIYRSVDLLVVKGKTKPVEVFALLSDRSQPAPAWLATYEAAVRLYRQRDFVTAAARFAEARKDINGEDYLCDMYLERCAAYRIDPPPENWDGSFTLTKK